MWWTEDAVGQKAAQQDARPSDERDDLVPDHVRVRGNHGLERGGDDVEGSAVEMGAVDRLVEGVCVAGEVREQPERFAALLGLVPRRAEVRRHRHHQRQQRHRKCDERLAIAPREGRPSRVHVAR